MQITFETDLKKLNVLLHAFNNSETPIDRLAYATAIKAALAAMLETLDNNVIPTFEAATAAQINRMVEKADK